MARWRSACLHGRREDAAAGRRRNPRLTSGAPRLDQRLQRLRRPTGRLQVWPWHSIAIGPAARGRSARGGPSGHSLRSRRSTVSDGSGARRATVSERLRRRVVERPVDHDRAAALEDVGAHQSERTAAEPLGRAGNRADEVLGRLAPARLVGQMPQADQNLGEQADARRASPRHATGADARPARRRRRSR